MLHAYQATAIAPLASGQYLPYLLNAVESAATRVWALMFFADVRLLEDPNRTVRNLIDALAYAAWVGVDVRLILSPTSAEDIEVGNGATAYYLLERGVTTRWFKTERHRSTHTKMALIDSDLVVVGSHNWTDRALGGSVEASLAIRSADVVQESAEFFARIWDSSQPVSS